MKLNKLFDFLTLSMAALFKVSHIILFLTGILIANIAVYVTFPVFWGMIVSAVSLIVIALLLEKGGE